jgi:TFIIF-interacting CTD phosphatase-like protein
MLKRIGLVGWVSATGFSTFICYKATRPADQKLNLVFDMDHTLLHGVNMKKLNDEIGYRLPYTYVQSPEDTKAKYALWKRPFVKPVIHFLSIFNNVHLFTRATKDYADLFCQSLDIDKFFVSKHYRSSLNAGAKDMSIINNKRDMCVLIDNKKFNQYQDQHFYHASTYDFNKQFDIGMIEILLYAIKINIFGLHRHQLYQGTINNSGQ